MAQSIKLKSFIWAETAFTSGYKLEEVNGSLLIASR